MPFTTLDPRTLAVDAVREANDNSVIRIFPRLGEIGTTADVIAMLDARETA